MRNNFSNSGTEYKDKWKKRDKKRRKVKQYYQKKATYIAQQT
jgi:hypothetical protein